jgi:hypothetical protein
MEKRGSGPREKKMFFPFKTKGFLDGIKGI